MKLQKNTTNWTVYAWGEEVTDKQVKAELSQHLEGMKVKPSSVAVEFVKKGKGKGADDERYQQHRITFKTVTKAVREYIQKANNDGMKGKYLGKKGKATHRVFPTFNFN